MIVRPPLERHEVLIFVGFAAAVALILVLALYGWSTGAWEQRP